MMINSKKDLKEYLSCEDKLYPLSHKKSYIFTKEPIVYIAKMQKYLRKAEYYKNSKKSIFGSLLYLINRKKKNKYERKINSEIPVNVFAKGLVIYHGGNVINSYSKVGENCKIHGGVVIGNKGEDNLGCPTIGDNVDIGFGAVVIGNIKIGNNVTIGANALINKDVEDNSVVVGNPMRIIRRK